MSRTARIAAGLLAAGVLLPAARAADFDPAGIEQVLAPHRTVAALTDAIFDPPVRCIALDAASELCVWPVSNRYASWKALAKAIGTSKQVNVICRLPRDGSPRADGSCIGIPRYSNRGEFRLPRTERGRRKSRSEVDAAREANAERARALLAPATDLESMVRVLGDVPVACAGELARERTCEWHLSNYTLGHGTVAASEKLSLHDKLSYDCRFGPDGALLGPCRAKVGH